MFSDFQDFYWLVYGDTVQLTLFILIVATVLSLIVIVFDRAVTSLTGKQDSD